MIKKILALALSVVMLFALVVPTMAATVGETGFAGSGDTPVVAKKGQAPVYKDGELYDTLEIVYSGNSSSNHGYKISANKSFNTISLDGVEVGYFTFDKKGNGPKGYTDFLAIYITDDDYIVDVRWDCSKYYAYASLDGVGTYLLPQLMQDNGKIQSFDQIWISVSKKETPPPVEDYGSLSIQKTVGSVPFYEWASDIGLTTEEVLTIIDGLKFTAYLLDGENGAHVPGKEYPGIMYIGGEISFGNELPVGWYEVVEEISGTAENYFVGEGGTKAYYVGENGVSTNIVDIISGMEGVGTIVYHDGTGGVNWKLPDVWNGQLQQYQLFQKLVDMGAQWIWDKENTYEYGIDGSVVKLDFTVDVAEETTAPIYFAADNAAVIYVNNERAAWTTVAFSGRNIPLTITEETTAATFFDSLAADQFDGRWSEGWCHMYGQDITLAAGENTITIFAANSASKGYYDENGSFVIGNTGTDNDHYNLLNNPCGLIFGFQLPGATFDNEPLVADYANVFFTKTVDGDQAADTFAFQLFQYDEAEDDYVISVSCDCQEDDCDGNYYADLSGIVYARNLSPGKYVFKEAVDVRGYIPRSYEDGLYFEIVRDSGGLKAIWDIAIGEATDDDGNPIVVNIPTLGALEVAANVTAQHDIVTYEPVYEDLWKENTKETLVSKSNHNLGTLNGHQVFVAVDIEAASSGDGISFEVADSSPSNIGIGYYYNVKIANDRIYVSLDDIKKADVGIMAAADKSGLTNGHPNGKNGTAQGNLTRENNTLSVALPGDADEYVYLFVHLAGGIQWYTGEKEIVGYEEVDRETVTDTYTGALIAILKDAEGNVVESKAISNNGSVTFEKLAPGEYTCVFSGDGFEDQEETVIIVAGETENVTFTVTVTYPDEEIGNEIEIGTIIPKPYTISAPLALPFNFDLSVDPDELMNSVELINSVEPDDSVELMDPVETIGPDEPGDLDESIDSDEPGDLVEPAGSDEFDAGGEELNGITED